MIMTYGLGDTNSDVAFGEGSAITAFVVGIGVIIAFKMLESKPRQSQSKRVWSSGAYRSEDSASEYRASGELRSKRRRGRK